MIGGVNSASVDTKLTSAARPAAQLSQAIVMRSPTMLTDWPTDVGLLGSWDRIEVKIAWAFLRRLTEETGQSFDHEFSSENLISVVDLD